MPFIVNYGNPYAPLVGEGIFNAAKTQTTFSRQLENARLQLTADQLEIERTRMNLSKSQTEVENAYKNRLMEYQNAKEQRETAMLSRKIDVEDKKMAFDQQTSKGYLDLAQQDRAMGVKRYEDAQNQKQLDEQNKLKEQDAEPFKPGQETPDGKILHVAIDGSKYWIKPEKDIELANYTQKKKIENQFETEKQIAVNKETEKFKSSLEEQKRLQNEIAENIKLMRSHDADKENARKEMANIDKDLQFFIPDKKYKEAKDDPVYQEYQNRKNELAQKIENADKEKNELKIRTENLRIPGYDKAENVAEQSVYLNLPSEIKNKLFQLKTQLKAGNYSERKKAVQKLMLFEQEISRGLANNE